METVGARAGFLLARTRAAQSGQTSVDQGHGWRGQAESDDVARCPPVTRVRLWSAVQALLIAARLGFGLDRGMVNGELVFENFSKSATCGFGIGSVG
jgi:hypothetical protein